MLSSFELHFGTPQGSFYIIERITPIQFWPGLIWCGFEMRAGAWGWCVFWRWSGPEWISCASWLCWWGKGVWEIYKNLVIVVTLFWSCVVNTLFAYSVW